MNERTSTRRMYAPYKMNTNDFRNSLIHVASLAEYSACKGKERKTQKQARQCLSHTVYSFLHKWQEKLIIAHISSFLKATYPFY